MIDIDSDFSGIGKEKIYTYLKDKYGEDRVIHVGTFMALGLASAAKDLLRIAGADFQEANKFTRVLMADLSWEDNLENIQDSYPDQYKFYLSNKEILDKVPRFLKKIRQAGCHAGGIVVLDKPVYEYFPVERAGKDVVTAFPESGQEQVLDELGFVKYDILGISILDVIEYTIGMIDEKILLVEEDGIKKYVPESYFLEKIKEERV